MRVMSAGDVCDECLVSLPKKCLTCDFPHRQVGERCENCEMEDITKSTRYCVNCNGYFEITAETQLHICNDCFARFRIPDRRLPADWNRPVGYRGV